MNLYLTSQTEHEGYDTYDSAVVVAEDEISATFIHPNGHDTWNGKHWTDTDDEPSYTYHHDWANPRNVIAKLIGTALDTYTEPQVICASFNAG